LSQPQPHKEPGAQERHRPAQQAIAQEAQHHLERVGHCLGQDELGTDIKDDNHDQARQEAQQTLPPHPPRLKADPPPLHEQADTQARQGAQGGDCPLGRVAALDIGGMDKDQQILGIVDAEHDARQADAQDEQDHHGREYPVAKAEGQVTPVDDGVLGMAAGKGGAGLRSRDLHARVGRPGDGEQVLEQAVDPDREQGNVAQAGPNALVQAPVDKGQQDEVEFLIAQKGQEGKEAVPAAAAERLSPQDDVSAPGGQRLQPLFHDASL